MCFAEQSRGAARPSGSHGELWLCVMGALIFLGLLACLYTAEQRHWDEVQAQNLAHRKALKCKPIKN